VTDEPKQIVEAGYDAMAERFAEWQKSITGSPRMRYLDELLRRLPIRPDVLELGSGAAVESTRVLAERGRLTGVDISAEQVRRARERLPKATFLHADMTEVEFPAESFDAVVAFYVFNHVPRADLPPLIQRAAAWLRPGGHLLGTFGASESAEGVQIEWCGVPMFFSSFSAEENRRFVREAGLELVLDEVVPQDEGEEGRAEFLWVLARKPR
jgi:ubiquinone/menaquinone biosynthesis C-methylase UbiE